MGRRKNDKIINSQLMEHQITLSIIVKDVLDNYYQFDCE